MNPIEFERKHEQSKQEKKDQSQSEEKETTSQPDADEQGLPTGCCVPLFMTRL
jgi:hypothetical protein